MFVRKWCDPEPSHGTWGQEESPDDYTAPVIVSVEWTPACPYPFVTATMPRQGEPVTIWANVTEEVNGSGIDFVRLSYRAIGSEWWKTPLILNSTTGLWTSIIPGQFENTTIEVFIDAWDNAGNRGTSSLQSYLVKSLLEGDINGDDKVDIWDIAYVAANFGEVG